MTTKEQSQQTPVNQSLARDWRLWFFVTAFLVLSISTILRVITPKNIPVQDNSWGQVTPGYSKISNAIEQFGQPIEQKTTAAGSEYGFKSDYKTMPHQIVTDKNGTIKFMKQFITFDEKNIIDNYIKEFGEADLELVDKNTGDAFTAYVFLDKGLVLIAHISSKVVQQKWYFEPTTKEIFLQSWGSSLTTEPRGPEPVDTKFFN